MLVVSMADFSANPMQYIKNAKAMPFRLIDGNKELAEVKAPRKSFFTGIKKIFTSKRIHSNDGIFVGVHNGKRPLAPLKGKIKMSFSGDWEISPEELFANTADSKVEQ